MRCPFCGNTDTQVKDSRPAEDHVSIRRRRFCPACGGRFTTYERVQLRDLVVIKSNGRREDFDRAKLDRSVRIALQKRPVEPERIDQMVSGIVRRLESMGETDIRAYQGNVEHFVSAQSADVSVRVIVDGRTGTSHAGTLDESAIREVLEEARENAGFAGRDEFAGLADPDGVPVTPQELWDDALEAFPTEKKVDIALELERLAVAQDARLRSADSAGPGPLCTVDRAVPLDWTDYNGHMNEARYLQAFSDASDRLMEIAGCDAAYVAAGGSFFTTAKPQ